MIYAVGDSHARVFQKITPIEVYSVSAASNMGLKNPYSKTQAKSKIDSFLRSRLKKEDDIIFLMGEVDCGFVIWYRVEKYNDSLESQTKESLLNYFSLIHSYINHCKRIIVCDVPPPTISNETKKYSEVAKHRHERLKLKVSQEEQTKLTLVYNENIKNFCSQNSLIYLEYTKECLGKNGIVLPELLNNDKSDHHLHQEKFSELLKIKLKKVSIL